MKKIVMYKSNQFSQAIIFCLVFSVLFFWGTSGVSAATYEENFTSQIIDNDYLVQYGNASWNADTTPVGTSVVVKVRTDSSFDMSGATAWASCSAVSSGTDISSNSCVADGERYLQYQITFGTDNSNLTPTFYDINFQTNVSTLISSVFDSQDSRNTLQGFDWTESLNGGNVLFQIRTSPDGSSWTNWCGPDNVGAECNRESFFTDFSGSETIDAIFQDNASDRYFQYKAILVSDSIGGSSLPEISRVNFDYDLPTTSTRTYQETYTSKIYTSSLTGYSQISWNENVLPDTSLSVKVRTDSNSNMSTAPAWSTCAFVSNNVDISSNNCVDDGEQYIQYQVIFGTDNTNVTPTFYDMHIYTEDLANLISSPFNSTAPDNVLGRVSWIEDSTLPSGAQVALSLRSASSLANLSSAVWTQVAFSNGSGITQGCSRENGTVDCDSSVIPAGMKDAVSDQYFQYKMELSASGGISPTVSQVQITYVVNGAPEVQAVSAVPNSSGNVDILYETKDPDTLSGTVTRGFVTPSFQYSLDGGTSWNNTTANCFLGAEDLVDKAVNQDTFTQYGATWDPSCEAGISITTFEADAKIQVTVDDNEAANSTDELASEIFTLDTKPPVPAAIPLIINAKTTPATLAISSTDNSAMQMRFGLESNLSDGTWKNYATTDTITLATNPDTVYIQFKDAYGNTSAISNETSPAGISSPMIQDTSNVGTTPPEYRLFIAWKALEFAPNRGFDQYVIYRSSDNITYTEYSTITDMLLNYYGDPGPTKDPLDTNQTYYYKMTVKDDYGNESAYSSMLFGKADGIQNAGEPGIGPDSTPPVITNVEVTPSLLYSTQATITWNTDELSDSYINYSAQIGNYANSKGLTTMVDDSSHYGPHAVTLTDLQPDTTYYFQVESTDQTGINTASLNYDGNNPLPNGFTFHTDPGPIIPNVTTSQVTNHSATVQWITNAPANSVVTYSINSNLSSPAIIEGSDDLVEQHEVDITNLLQGTTYYYQVESTNASGTTIENNGNNFYTFTTTVDGVGPIITFNSLTDITNITDTGAKISWLTNESSQSTLEYGTNGEYTETLTNENYNTNHIFDLTNLTKGTTYNIRLTSTDINNNPTVLSGTSFTTSDSSDYGFPVITFNPNEDIFGITETSARISWVTNELTISQIEYGTDTNYGTTLNNPNLNTNHIFNLTNLTKDTIYYFKLTSTDGSSNTTTNDNNSNGFTLTTTDLADYDAPIITFNPNQDITNITDTSARINWSTNESAISRIEYGSDTNYGIVINNPNYNTSHSFDITNLTKATTYYFKLTSIDSSSNTTVDDNASNGYTLITSDSTDYDAPIITFNPSTNITNKTDTSVRISWTTNELANSLLNYGSNAQSLDQSQFNPSYNTNHTFELTNLTKGTIYYFTLTNTDTGGNTATDNNNTELYSFNTEDLTDYTDPVITFNPNQDIFNVTETSARISWVTNELTISQIEYGTDTNYGNTLNNPNLNSNHIFNITSLTPNTKYFFKLISADGSANITEDDNGGVGYTFTTEATEEPQDQTGPEISGVNVLDVTYNSAKIAWVTGEVGDSFVDFSTDQNYEDSRGKFNESTTIHEVILNGLNSVTTYYYRVRSMETNHNITTKSTDSETSNPDNGELLQFTTASPTTDSDSDGEGDQLTDVMAQIQEMIDSYNFTQQEIKDALSGLYSISITSSGPSVSITDTQAEITWTTNRPSVGKVYYWQDTDSEDTATSQAEAITSARTDHEVIIKNLNANTIYNYYAYSEGLLGTTTQSDIKSFSTGDTAQLSGISISNLTLNSADISWTTTGSIDSSQLEYGESINYNKSDQGKTTNNLHTVSLTNLKENTTYHLRVTAEDSDGQTLTSDDYSFTTVSLPIISNIQIKDITTESVEINWQTNVKTDSRVEFKKEGETKGTTSGELEAVTDHTFTLTNLFPGTRYSFKVSSKDTFNNESSSEEQSFTTEEDLNPPIITNVKSDTTVFPGKEAQIQTIISWNTDKDSNSILAYRQGVEKDPTLVDQLKNPDTNKVDNWKLIKKSDLTKNHLFVLTDLKPASVYQFRTASFDKHNNVSVSENYSLLTPTKQQSVLDLIISNFESTFGWVKRIGNN